MVPTEVETRLRTLVARRRKLDAIIERLQEQERLLSGLRPDPYSVFREAGHEGLITRNNPLFQEFHARYKEAKEEDHLITDQLFPKLRTKIGRASGCYADTGEKIMELVERSF